MRESGSEGGPLCADKENGFGGRGGALKAERPLKSGLDQRQGTDPTGSDRWASAVAVQCVRAELATQGSASSGTKPRRTGSPPTNRGRRWRQSQVRLIKTPHLSGAAIPASASLYQIGECKRKLISARLFAGDSPAPRPSAEYPDEADKLPDRSI